MLDKDFDAFFRSSLADVEVVPSADSWVKISDQISPKPKRKKSLTFWMKAASIVIVLGIGIGLYTRPIEVIKLHPDEGNELLGGLVQEQKAPHISAKKTKPVAKVTKTSALKPVPSKLLTEESASSENIVEEIPFNEPAEIQELATIKNVKSVRPKLVTEQLLEQEAIADLKKQDATTLNENKDSFIANAFSTKKLKMSSVGDLVNLIVAKVDKRDDKIVRISKTEESDNEITGINLGLIKFTKRD